MKILLLGECSNLHWTLAQGLRKLGHNVTVASDGSRWMDNARDISLCRKGYGLVNTIGYIYDIYKNRERFKGYDVVQIKNPVFLDLKAEKNLRFFHFLKKHNKKVFLGAFGTDYYWIKSCHDGKTFRYSDFFIGDKPTGFPEVELHARGWTGTSKQAANEEIARSCDGIISCLYEYYVSYVNEFRDKLAYIPLPVNTDEVIFKQRIPKDKLNFFIGIQTDRAQLKGADILYKVLQEVHASYPGRCSIQKAESVPYAEYMSMMDDSDVLLDQLYSYTPGMNALAAMAKGLVTVSGGEPESYDILNEKENRPIINVLPDESDIYRQLEWLILNKEEIPGLSLRSRQFIEKHHDYLKVAHQYLDFWNS